MLDMHRHLLQRCQISIDALCFGVVSLTAYSFFSIAWELTQISLVKNLIFYKIYSKNSENVRTNSFIIEI